MAFWTLYVCLYLAQALGRVTAALKATVARADIDKGGGWRGKAGQGVVAPARDTSGGG